MTRNTQTGNTPLPTSAKHKKGLPSNRYASLTIEVNNNM